MIKSWFRNIILFFYKPLLKVFSRKGLNRITFFRKIGLFLSFYIRSGRPDYIVVQGNKMYLDPIDSLGLSIKEYEPLATRLVQRSLKEGDVFVDVGAHIGYYTLLAAKKVGTGKVYAFEPHPDNIAILQKNIEVNGYSNVEIIQNAVSDKRGKVKLYVCDYNWGGHSIFNFYKKPELVIPHTYKKEEQREKFIEVEAITLDGVFGNDNVDFIKMDIQGAEGLALKGMRNLLLKNKSIKVLAEFWPKSLGMGNFDPEKYLNTFRKLGFQIYEVDEKKKKIILRDISYLVKNYTPENKKSVNLFFIRE